jgi:putative ABC transport system permease protein
MIAQHNRMAINSLRNNKVRTFLTLLGIIIGITSVTTIIGLGEGVKRQVNQQVSDLGSNLVSVVPGRAVNNFDFTNSNNFFGTSDTTARLSQADLSSIRQLPNVRYGEGIMQLDGSISKGTHKQSVRILAVDNDYLKVTKQKLSSGQFFGDDLENKNTVILAANVAQTLFGDEDPLGSSVNIYNKTFTIVGVLDMNKGFNFGRPINDLVLIPLETGKTLNQDSLQFQQISVVMEDPELARQTASRIRSVLLKNHNGEEDFTVTTQGQLAQTTDSVFKALTTFTAAVASISLLVGGIGVMNIMLVTVTERTREIGIRKALGATRLQIMMQFLIEALWITLVGGFIGIILSLLIGVGIKSQTAIQPATDPWILLLAAAVSLGVGIVFGTWPAIRAARKDPIDALRHD